jgi:hypothetical protein
MKKILILAVLLGVCLFGFAACGDDNGNGAYNGVNAQSNGTAVNDITEETEEAVNRIDLFFERVAAAGFDMGEEVPKVPQMIGAERGAAYHVNGVVVEIYEYSPDNLTDDGRVHFENARDNGLIEVLPGFPPAPVVFHNNLVIIVDEHPDYEQLIEIFRGLN